MEVALKLNAKNENSQNHGNSFFNKIIVYIDTMVTHSTSWKKNP